MRVLQFFWQEQNGNIFWVASIKLLQLEHAHSLLHFAPSLLQEQVLALQFLRQLQLVIFLQIEIFLNLQLNPISMAKQFTSVDLTTDDWDPSQPWDIRRLTEEMDNNCMENISEGLKELTSLRDSFKDAQRNLLDSLIVVFFF